MTWWMALLITAVLAVGAAGAARPVLRRLQLVDQPNHRSSHDEPTLRGGGIAPLLAIILVGLVALILGAISPALVWTLAGGLAFGVLGLLEDVIGLSVALRLGAQILIAVIGAVCLLQIWDTTWWLLILVVLAGFFLVNAVNFMDGVNGITSFHALVAGGAAIAVGLITGQVGLAVAGAILAGAFAGFLPWNFPRARMFLGDVGSYLLGGMAWTIGVWLWQATRSILVGASPMLIYATDVIVTLIRRALHHQRLTEAHCEHYFQRLRQATGSHVIASLVPTAASALIAVEAVWTLHAGLPMLGWVLAVISCAGYVGVCSCMSRGGRRVNQVDASTQLGEIQSVTRFQE